MDFFSGIQIIILFYDLQKIAVTVVLSNLKYFTMQAHYHFCIHFFPIFIQSHLQKINNIQATV